MESISDTELAATLQISEGRDFLTRIIEPLADSFDPALAPVYIDVFTRAVERTAPELLHRIWRTPVNPLPSTASRVYVLSRITLGADVAVTSVLMDAAKRRYPAASIVFVGPRKNYELFEADPRIAHMEAPYARSGALRDRLAATASLWFTDGIVLDPDSRLTQLGLFRVCDESRYFWFDSRSFGGEASGGGSLDRLPDLAAQWASDPEAKPYIAPATPSRERVDITVSLGVGENHDKRLDQAFEAELLRLLAATGLSVIVDFGGTPEERARVAQALRPGMRTHDGPFAPFAAEIARSKLFVGYDSAGGHVASASGVPVISIAKGFLNERMAARWRPLGTIVDGASSDPLAAVRTALATYTGRR